MADATPGASPKSSRRKNLTAEEKSEIAILREKGWGLERLAEKFKCTTGSISWCCLMQGVTAPGNANRRPNRASRPYARGAGTVRPFTPAEDDLIEKMRAGGAGLSEIAQATKRRHNSIVGRLACLARKRETGA